MIKDKSLQVFLDELASSAPTPADRSVDVQIVNIRKKLGMHSGLIETVRGVGYRFQEQ